MIVSWNSTNRCNLFCDHCYRESGAESGDELTTAEARQLIQDIKKCGFHMMVFSGGEPLMRDDIYELGAYAKDCGLRPVLGTNGTLITAGAAEKLKHAGFAAAGVSLDSLYPEKHDSFRKLEGAHDRALSGMQALRATGVPFQIHTTVMKWNVNELDGIANRAIEIGARALHVFFLVSTGRAKMLEQQALCVSAYEKTIYHLMKLQQKLKLEIKPTCAPQFMRIARQLNMRLRYTRGCLAGTEYCIISPRGFVQPCPYLDIYLGNVRETSFYDIWHNDEVLLNLRSMNYSGACGRCSYKDDCGGCRARAYYHSGDLMSEDPWCSLADDPVQ